ncbi:unnamed protein product [Chrysodeixis includens]|uniref:Uncharacterized protein n=1 Tax=Chrysodeixis includens TaxID=689277 RepID=A0A9N8KWF5_CHRIL|nr:unnamed protein product [Chrysodeixis includens]
MPTLHLKPGITMARYKKTGFMDDDAGSVSSIQLNEGVRSGGTHIRYHMVRDSPIRNKQWKRLDNYDRQYVTFAWLDFYLAAGVWCY